MIRRCHRAIIEGVYPFLGGVGLDMPCVNGNFGVVCAASDMGFGNIGEFWAEFTVNGILAKKFGLFACRQLRAWTIEGTIRI